MPQGEPQGEDLAQQIDAFFVRYPVDERARGYLLDSDDAVVLAALQEFKPRTEGEKDYSGLLTSYVKRLRQRVGGDAGRARQAYNGQGSGGAVGPAPGALPRDREPLHRELQEAVDDFVQRYPIDDGAFGYLTSSPPEVIVRVIEEFRPKAEGESDYSALLMTFAKRCRNKLGVAAAEAYPPAQYHEPPRYHEAPQAHGPSQSECSRFFSRYPCDERALDYFDTSGPEVQRAVLSEFKPKQEGESDYSSLITAFCKKKRQNVAQDNAWHGQQRYAHPPTPRYHAPVGPAFGGKGYAPMQPVRHQMVQPGGPRPADLQAFRNRFPMDDRAFSYLTESTPEVCDRVLATFVPPRLDDTDYSAPVTSYVKQCRKQLPVVSYGPGAGVPHAGHWGGQAALPASHKGAWPSHAAQPKGGRDSRAGGGDLDAALRRFLDRYPVDERATDYLCTQPPHILDRVLHEFQPKKEGDSDYSAIVMSFTKRCRDQDRSAGDQMYAPPWKRART
jgi:hypothetical protein